MVTLALIAEKLEEMGAVPHHIPPIGRPLRGCRFLEDPLSDSSKDHAYLTDANSLDACQESLSHLSALIVVGDSDPNRAHLPYLFIPTQDRTMGQILGMVQDVFESYEYGFFQALATSAVRDRNIEKLLEIAYPFFDNPIYLCDSAFQLLAFSRTAAVNKPTPQWMSVTKRGHLDPDIIKGVKVSKIEELDSLKHATFVESIDAEGVTDIVTHIEKGGARIANLTIVGSERPLEPYHLALADYLTECVKGVLESDFSYNESDGALYERWIALLLSGQAVDASQIEPHLKRMKWSIDDRYQVAVVEFFEDRSSGANTLDYYWRLLSLALPEHKCFIYHNSIVILMHGTAHDRSTLTLGRSACELIRNNGLRCCLSLPFDSLFALRAHHEQARRMQWAATSKEPIAHYADHLLDDILNEVSFSSDWDAAILPEVRKMAEDDRLKGTDLVRTLSVYLSCSCNYTEAAEALNLHRNTVIYRIGRMQEVYGVDVDEHANRLPYLISCAACLHQRPSA